MGYYKLNLDELSEYTGMTIGELKVKSYAELETMVSDMKKNKFMNRNNQNAEDTEYERLVLKYYQLVPLLRHWFTDREIVLACANTGVDISDICGKELVKPGYKCYYDNAEYIRTSMETVPRYDRSGNQLMYGERKEMDVYRVANQYQGLTHGKVVLHLLYGRYPELSEYGFKAYGMSIGESDYEIYPENNIYTSLTALMSGDIDYILHRNREYCRLYNNGRYTPDECEKAFRTDEAQKMFDLIYRIGKKEISAGHLPVKMSDSGKLIMANRMEETAVSKSGNVKLLQSEMCVNRKRCFTMDLAAPYGLEDLVCEFVQMVNTVNVNVHVYHVMDYLGAYGVHINMKEGSGPKGFIKGRTDISGYVVHGIFGWSYGGIYDLTIRIDCPEMTK